ncbi:unnamed protein product [Phaeothamnion confervicola]
MPQQQQQQQPPPPPPASPPAHPLDDIRALLAAGRVNEAIDKALAASEVRMVVWTCRQLDHSAVPRHLSQGALLCLLSQLSTDLPLDAATKLLWLQGCALALRTGDSTIAQFVPAVLRQVRTALEEAAPEIRAEGPHAASTLSLLSHVITSLQSNVESGR